MAVREKTAVELKALEGTDKRTVESTVIGVSTLKGASISAVSKVKRVTFGSWSRDPHGRIDLSNPNAGLIPSFDACISYELIAAQELWISGPARPTEVADKIGSLIKSANLKRPMVALANVGSGVLIYELLKATAINKGIAGFYLIEPGSELKRQARVLTVPESVLKEELATSGLLEQLTSTQKDGAGLDGLDKLDPTSDLQRATAYAVFVASRFKPTALVGYSYKPAIGSNRRRW